MEISHDGNMIIELHLGEIQKIKGVDEFMKSIISYVDPARHLDAPERVGHMYLAFLLSLSYAKLIVTGSWSSSAAEEDRARFFRRLPTPESKLKRKRGGDNLDTDTEFFLRLQQSISDEPPIDVEHAKKRRFDSVDSEVQGQDGAGASPVGPRPNTTPTQQLASALTDVGQAEATSLTVTHRVNRAYYDLGAAYVHFAELTFDSCPSASSSTFHQLVFGSVVVAIRAMAAEPALQTMSEAGLKKRLERSRKFFVLVECFGRGVLGLVPLVCVTRLDKLSFASIRRYTAFASASNLGMTVMTNGSGGTGRFLRAQREAERHRSEGERELPADSLSPAE
ncbi:hypothetical protein BDZ90DRAFT_276394 [Jaminaea rosea]|uniref:Uncharacterized protein n=1 Tax=Jaminaea rosea TaxID=1569628 RepID=A0A316UJ32_9BASI|nr:hypothetical protein BDZ90DRAFT_276394 [Jaminaea rosea]PWN24351.1 hypothetical protein BDZ90DRAFT_276394 [Jaminaea rosea]